MRRGGCCTCARAGTRVATEQQNARVMATGVKVRALLSAHRGCSPVFIFIAVLAFVRHIFFPSRHTDQGFARRDNELQLVEKINCSSSSFPHFARVGLAMPGFYLHVLPVLSRTVVVVVSLARSFSQCFSTVRLVAPRLSYFSPPSSLAPRPASSTDTLTAATCTADSRAPRLSAARRSSSIAIINFRVKNRYTKIKPNSSVEKKKN